MTITGLWWLIDIITPIPRAVADASEGVTAYNGFSMVVGSKAGTTSSSSQS